MHGQAKQPGSRHGSSTSLHCTIRSKPFRIYDGFLAVSSLVAHSPLQNSAATSSVHAPGHKQVLCSINNVPVQCLVDTSASITCINPSVLLAIGKNEDISTLKLPRQKPLLANAVGSPVTSADTFSLSFTMPNGSAVTSNAFVIPALSYECILGMDILRHVTLPNFWK